MLRILTVHMMAIMFLAGCGKDYSADNTRQANKLDKSIENRFSVLNGRWISSDGRVLTIRVLIDDFVIVESVSETLAFTAVEVTLQKEYRLVLDDSFYLRVEVDDNGRAIYISHGKIAFGMSFLGAWKRL